MFQSAPGLSTRGNGEAPIQPHVRRSCFNPPLASRPGETQGQGPEGDHQLVSIRPWPLDQGKRGKLARNPRNFAFQSAPGLSTRGNLNCHGGDCPCCFNPPLASRPGETRSLAWPELASPVSIRPWPLDQGKL